MQTDRLAAGILHAVGLPAQWNAEYVTDCIAAVAAWKRWSAESAAKWLQARANAAMEQGITVDKWWFINGAYRQDPRPVEVVSSAMPGKPDCDICHGSGWALITVTTKYGKQAEYATVCACRGGARVVTEVAADMPQIGALANAKRMGTP